MNKERPPCVMRDGRSKRAIGHKEDRRGTIGRLIYLDNRLHALIQQDGFHVMRSYLLADKYGLSPRGR